MSTPTRVTIHSTGSGTCALTQRDGEGLTVTFEDGTVSEQFLSRKGFHQLLGMRVARNGKPAPVQPAAVPNGTGK